MVEIFGNPDALSALERLSRATSTALFWDRGIGKGGWHGQLWDTETVPKERKN